MYENQCNFSELKQNTLLGPRGNILYIKLSFIYDPIGFYIFRIDCVLRPTHTHSITILD